MMARMFEARRLIGVLAVLMVVAVALVGCGGDDAEVSDEELGQTVEEFTGEVEGQLAQSNLDIEDLEGQLENLDEETQEEIRQAVDDLRQQQLDIEGELEGVVDDETRQEAEQSISDALDQLQQAIEEAQARADEGQ